jgi:hypothetical protein
VRGRPHLNRKTARSQVIGGMTMGAGAALMEALVVDKRHGFFVNHGLSGTYSAIGVPMTAWRSTQSMTASRQGDGHIAFASRASSL